MLKHCQNSKAALYPELSELDTFGDYQFSQSVCSYAVFYSIWRFKRTEHKNACTILPF